MILNTISVFVESAQKNKDSNRCYGNLQNKNYNNTYKYLVGYFGVSIKCKIWLLRYIS